MGFGFLRNKTTFPNIKDNHPAIIRFVSSDISSHLRIDFDRLTSCRFLDQWSLPPLSVLMMVFLMSLSRYTPFSLSFSRAWNAVSVT